MERGCPGRAPTAFYTAPLTSDGSLDSSFNPGTGADAVVRSIALQSDGNVLIGGLFTTVNGTNRNRMARLNANGSLDDSFHPGRGLDGPVPGFWLQPDGKVLFTPRDILKRLNANGTPDTNFVAVANPVSSIRLQPDGRIFIAGGFAFVNGTQRGGIARLNANGSLDNSFNPGTGANGSVSSFVFQSDGRMLIGGSFTAVNGTNRNRIARLNANGSLDLSFNPGTGANGPVRSIALQSDGKVLIGGDFLTVDGVLRPYLARLYGDSPAPSLNIARSNAFVIVSWPVAGLNFQLQENTDLSLPNSWSPVAQPAMTNAGQISVTVPTTVGRKFFRLKAQ